ncbi:hypothetical protein OCV67_13605, partial [Porcipelethomonas ammoniilytica]|uniref:hypothetical protein n=1 Tax=Porcipelethomonas ammoniilytica TaxID=2981722 RepID=UPI00374DAA5B|nr:hypothetical protein [Porcipelethomonas ammoniilytica]
TWCFPCVSLLFLLLYHLSLFAVHFFSIAPVHDAKTEKQKADLFDKVNKGEIRVLLGSTGKMGTGTNCQKKLIALHNLDIPWVRLEVA